MATAARLPLAAWRNEVCVRTIQFVGIDLTDVDMRAQVRLRPDAPGAPLIALETVPTAASQGVKLDGVSVAGGVPTSTVIFRINKTTMQDAAKLPYGGEAGSDTVFAYAIQFGGVTRVVGQFIALAAVMDSDGATGGSVSGYGAAGSGMLPWNAAQLTFSDDAIEISIDGAELLAPLVAQATAAGADAVAAAERAETAAAEAEAFADQFGYRYNFITDPTEFTDAGSVTNVGSHYVKTPFARTVIVTAATRLRVHAFSTLATFFPEFAKLGVKVNGAYLPSLQAPATDGPFYADLTLASGPKTIEFIDGTYSKPNALLGTFFKAVEGNAPVPQVFPPAVDRIVVLGDSIMSGGNADDPPKDAWVQLLREFGTRSIATIGYGFNTFADTCGNGFVNDIRDANVAQIKLLTPTLVINALLTNDFPLLKFGTLAQLRTAIESWLDKLHAEMPNAKVLLLLPIIRGAPYGEGVQNPYGFTIQDHRDQAIAAAVGRSWVSVANGKDAMTVEYVPDGVHPGTPGHRKLAQFVGAHPWVNITVPDITVDYDLLNAGPDGNGEITVLGEFARRYTKTGNTGPGPFNGGIFGEPQAADYRYQIKVPVAVNLMIGLNTSPANGSGFNDHLHDLYLTPGGSMNGYDGGSPGTAPVFTNWTITEPTLNNFFQDRSGTTVTVKQGADYASARTLLTWTGVTGSVALDMAMVEVGGIVEVTKLI